MAVARALGEGRLSPWHNLIPDTSVFFAALMHCTYARDGKAVSLFEICSPQPVNFIISIIFIIIITGLSVRSVRSARR